MKHHLAKLGAAVALTVCTVSTSCIGPNNAYNSLHTWNSKLSDSKYVNELAFLGLNIVPAYPLFLFGDYILFNSWEFWTGKNLIVPAEPFEPQHESSGD